MQYFDVLTFLKSFYLVFLVLASVGPGFLTIANIAMTKGYKTSAVAVCGCFLGDCILISLGAICAKKVVDNIPQTALTILGFVAVFFLLYLSVRFWRINTGKIKKKTFSKTDGFSLAITLFCLKMSSPICIGGYGVIFSTILTYHNYVLSAIVGGIFASIVVNTLMVSIFGTIGKKININILRTISKISSIFIGGFAVCLLVNIIKGIIF